MVSRVISSVMKRKKTLSFLNVIAVADEFFESANTITQKKNNIKFDYLFSLNL